MGFKMRSAIHSFLFLAASFPFAAHAQQSDMTIVHLWANATVSLAQEKQCGEQLQALDPEVRFTVHADRQRLKVGLFVQWDVESVRSALAQAGVLTTVLPGSTSAGTVKSMDPALDGFPVFIDTGHPLSDDQDYQAAKAAWIQTHPQAYQQLVGGAPAE